MTEYNSMDISNIELLKNITERMPVMIYIYDVREKEILYLNEYTKNLFKENSSTEIIAKLGIQSEALSSSNEAFNHEKILNSTVFKMSEAINIFTEGRIVKIGIGVDVTQSKEDNFSEHIDKLTGAYDQIIGMKKLRECINRVKEEGSFFSLCILETNKRNYSKRNFDIKEENEYIKIVAETSKKIIRRSDIFARISDDKFIIILPDCPVLTAQRIMQYISKNLEEISGDRWQGFDYSINCNVIEVNNEMNLNVEDIMRKLENEMYRNSFESKKSVSKY